MTKLAWSIRIEYGDNARRDEIGNIVDFPANDITESGVDAVCDEIKRSMIKQIERLELNDAKN